MTVTFKPKTILDPIDEFLGYPIENADPDELEHVSSDDLVLLADSIDKVLRDSWQQLPTDGAVSPLLPFGALHAVTEEKWIPAKLSLIHRRVLLDVGTFGSPLKPDGRAFNFDRHCSATEVAQRLRDAYPFLASHAPLLRSGAITLYSDHVYDTMSLHTLAQKSADRFVAIVKKDRAAKAALTETVPELDYESGYGDINPWGVLHGMVESTYSHLHCTRKVNAQPLFISKGDYRLWLTMREHLVAPVFASTPEISSLLETISMPKFSNIPCSDIIAIHNNSEAFFKWRVGLESALRRTAERASLGEDVQTVFKEEVLELRYKAEAIDKEVKSSPSLLRSIKSATQTLLVGGASLVLGVPVLESLGIDPGVAKKGVELATACAVGNIAVPLLFSKPKPTDKVISNMYHAVFDDR